MTEQQLLRMALEAYQTQRIATSGICGFVLSYTDQKVWEGCVKHSTAVKAQALFHSLLRNDFKFTYTIPFNNPTINPYNEEINYLHNPARMAWIKKTIAELSKDPQS